MQLDLPFDAVFAPGDNPALWSPREIWVKLTQRMMEAFPEDRRIDYKSGTSVNIDDLATYISMFSNVPEGGVIVFGADSKGIAHGCSKLPAPLLNGIERCHIQRCPQAKPEFKRIPVIVNGEQDFCIAIYIPYVAKLVETNKGDAFTRYGDSKHKMTDEEKRDFRSTRGELSFEMDVANYAFPDEFDLRIIQDFCDSFRTKESRQGWSNTEVLLDRHLLREEDEKLRPTNALVLLAAKDPRKTIPGCRVRVQRFATDQEGVGSSYNPIRDRFVEGNVINIINGVSDAIQELNYNVTWLNSEGKFVTTTEYPRWAWLEALVNACVHRSYSFSGSEITVKFFPERLEIESPGGFVPPVNETTIYHTRAARNHHFMDAMRVLGYVQMAREGTRRILQSMKDWGLPDPIFKQEAVHGVLVRVTLMNDHESRKRATDADVASHFGVALWRRLQEHEIKIAAYTFRNGKIQVTEAQRLTGRTWATSKKDLERLRRNGVLDFVAGAYSRDAKAHYILSKKSRSDGA
ncbi:ATP-binding protein [Aquamicrobium zhengzhouense]|uniref:DNA binding domain-containing protein n=1 Tax=Aquamicrobium zhengzhouense TaxID=2781738 RepID=A0ABS0SAT7_9HYPH|nr:ATP-binding protein [Aquamicrobium zhengzhouense]MBI1620376.1 putative DNA binding domain-containing protein [Aquamicrobium zhengzhouense]